MTMETPMECHDGFAESKLKVKERQLLAEASHGKPKDSETPFMGVSINGDPKKDGL